MSRYRSILLAAAIALTTPLTLTLWSSAHAQTPPQNTYITATNRLAVADELDIRQVIARLNHALDAADYQLYASFFTPSAVFASDFGDATGPQQIAQALEASRPLITNKRHVAANLVISGSGNQAIVTSYLIVFERAESLTYVGSAINVDTLEKQGGQWLVTRHESTLDPATLDAIQAAMQAQQQ